MVSANQESKSEGECCLRDWRRPLHKLQEHAASHFSWTNLRSCFYFTLHQVVSYYVRCAKTNNHTVREAACNCLAELFVKIDKTAVQPHLPKIQRTLFRALKDDSWTVSSQ